MDQIELMLRWVARMEYVYGLEDWGVVFLTISTIFLFIRYLYAIIGAGPVRFLVCSLGISATIGVGYLVYQDLNSWAAGLVAATAVFLIFEIPISMTR